MSCAWGREGGGCRMTNSSGTDRQAGRAAVDSTDEVHNLTRINRTGEPTPSAQGVLAVFCLAFSCVLAGVDFAGLLIFINRHAAHVAHSNGSFDRFHVIVL